LRAGLTVPQSVSIERQTFHADILRSAMTLADENVRTFLRAHSPLMLSNIVEGQAIVLAYADATYAIALVAVVSIPLVFLMRKARTARTPAVERPQEPTTIAVAKVA
jgi:hypothetical protein